MLHRILLLVLAGRCASAWQPHLASRPAQLSASARCMQRAAFPIALADSTDALGKLISNLRGCTPDQLPKVLADNLGSIDQRLFLRLAEMSDAEDDPYEQLRIRQLSTLIASTVETLLEQADAQISQDAGVVQELLRKMALDSGEFEVPVPKEKMSALREAMRAASPPLDEGFVATVKAYMKKSSDDGLDGMVDLLRTLLQTFASERLRSLAADVAGDDDGRQAAVRNLLDVSPEEWESVLRAELLSDDASCTPDELAGLLQDKMGEVVLGMPAGSAVQNVVAEYLNELITRTRSVAAEQA